jgi:hypothetical protein
MDELNGQERIILIPLKLIANEDQKSCSVPHYIHILGAEKELLHRKSSHIKGLVDNCMKESGWIILGRV